MHVRTCARTHARMHARVHAYRWGASRIRCHSVVYLIKGLPEVTGLLFIINFQVSQCCLIQVPRQACYAHKELRCTVCGRSHRCVGVGWPALCTFACKSTLPCLTPLSCLPACLSVCLFSQLAQATRVACPSHHARVHVRVSIDRSACDCRPGADRGRRFETSLSSRY